MFSALSRRVGALQISIIIIIVVAAFLAADRSYIALFSALEQTHCTRM